MVFKGKSRPTLEKAIENLPEEFWSRLTEEQQDEVEKRLTKYFKEGIE